MKDDTWRPRELAFVGPSGSGKTTLIERLVRHLTESGSRVAVVKHTHHHIDWDQPGKDSWRFREAGAAAVLLATPERLLLQKPRAGRVELDGAFAGTDIVIHEGDRQSSVDKLLVGESVAESLAKGTRGRMVALVGNVAEAGLPLFDRDDIAGVARFLLDSEGGRDSLGPGFEQLLRTAVAAHGHLCPGQVLGVRMTMRGLGELGMDIPPPPKRLIAVVETDRCAADAVASVSGCSLGRRTLKHFDFGKMAASFLDLGTGAAVRVVARDDSRDLVPRYANGIDDRHEAQTIAYRLMPDSELLNVQRISFQLTEADMPGRPRSRVPCLVCGEHISDDRQVVVSGEVLCRACAGAAYYAPA